MVVSLLLLALTLGFGSEAWAREKWGPFRGQIVDLETGKPIAGAVMVVVWLESSGIFGQHEFYEAREAVTDADGRWEVPRLSVPAWILGVQPPTFHTFAPGYVAYANIVTPITGELFVDPTVLQMRRLKTREEILQKSHSGPPLVPPGKMPQYIRAVNDERRMLGLKPIESEGGKSK